MSLYPSFCHTQQAGHPCSQSPGSHQGTSCPPTQSPCGASRHLFKGGAGPLAGSRQPLLALPQVGVGGGGSQAALCWSLGLQPQAGPQGSHFLQGQLWVLCPWSLLAPSPCSSPSRHPGGHQTARGAQPESPVGAVSGGWNCRPPLALQSQPTVCSGLPPSAGSANSWHKTAAKLSMVDEGQGHCPWGHRFLPPPMPSG